MKRTDVRGATHVKLENGTVKKIESKWGIDKTGKLAPPSQGGFGVITTDKQRINMYEAHSYWSDKP